MAFWGTDLVAGDGDPKESLDGKFNSVETPMETTLELETAVVLYGLRRPLQSQK